MFRQIWNFCRPPFMKGPLSEVNTGDPLFYIKHFMDGTVKAVFHPNLIKLLDRVFILDGTKFLTIDQERFMARFFHQAGIVTDKINAGNPSPYADMDSAMRDLDEFLGKYRGKHCNECTR